MNITGTILKNLRMKKHLTLEELANELNDKFDINITRSMLSKWETGKSAPVYGHLKRLAAYFNVTTDFLLGFSDDNFQNIDIDLDTPKRIRKTKKSYEIENIIETLNNDKFTSKHIALIQYYIRFLEYEIDNNIIK